MECSNFLQWFEHQLTANSEELLSILMDNTNYHSTLINKSFNAPTTALKKAGIKE